MSIDSLAEIGPAVDSEPRARERVAAWRVISLRLAIAASAGCFLAIAWLLPGIWLPVWVGQALLITLALTCRPCGALAYGGLGGALAIGLSFYWGVAALQTTCEASLLTASLVFAFLVAFEAAGFGLFCLILSVFFRRG